MPPQGLYADGREMAFHQHVFSQDLDKLRGNPTAIMAVMDKYTTGNVQMMTFKSSKIKVAREILEKVRPKTIVELGTYVGFSAVAWGMMLKDFHPDPRGCKVITMEKDEYFAQIASDIIKLAGLDDIVQVVHGRSEYSLRKMASYGVFTIDCLFVDHWEKFYLPDLLICEELNLFHQGTVIIADNTDIPGAPDYLKHVKGGGRGKYSYSSTTYRTEGANNHPKVLEITIVE